MLSAPFATSDKLMALAVTAEKFGQRPSTLLGIGDQVLALEVDLAGAMALQIAKGSEDGGGVEHLYV